MSTQYPVNNQKGLYDAVNTLLSGPSGLGQNFAGFSDYRMVYLTGNYRQPFSVLTTATINPPLWYVPPIAVTNAVIVNNQPGSNTSTNYEISFVPQPTAPFQAGGYADPEGIVDSLYGINSNFNGSSRVLSGTTSTAVFQTNYAYDFGTYVSGGTITNTLVNSDPTSITYYSTDCNARVVVTGPTDRVFISAQIDLEYTYDCSTASTWDVVTQITRYVPTTVTPSAAGDYTFHPDPNGNSTVSQKTVTHSSTSSGSIIENSIVFSTVIDQPSFGYYWYILEIAFNQFDRAGNMYPGDFKPVIVQAGLRSLTAQVVKL